MWRVKLLSHLPACGALIPTKPHFEDRHQTGRDKAESLYFCIIRETDSLHTVMRALGSSSRNRAALWWRYASAVSFTRLLVVKPHMKGAELQNTFRLSFFFSESNMNRTKFHTALQHSPGGLGGSSVSQNYSSGSRFSTAAKLHNGVNGFPEALLL